MKKNNNKNFLVLYTTLRLLKTYIDFKFIYFETKFSHHYIIKFISNCLCLYYITKFEIHIRLLINYYCLHLKVFEVFL